MPTVYRERFVHVHIKIQEAEKEAYFPKTNIQVKKKDNYDK